MNAIDLIAKAKARASRLLTDGKEAVAKQGGVTQVLKKGSLSVVGYAAHGVGYVADKIEGNPSGPDSHAATYRKETVAAVQSVATDVKSGLEVVVKGVSDFSKNVDSEIALPADKTVMLGSTSYTLAVDTKREARAVAAYLREVSAKIPSQLPGRDEVLRTICTNGLATDASLSSYHKRLTPQGVTALGYATRKID